MVTIHLHKLMFYSYHGIHDEEKLVGSEYELSAAIQFNEAEEVIHSIRQTINYAEIYEIIKQRMNISTPLLETIIMEVGLAIKKKHENVISISIHLKKLHPPITGIMGSVGVSWNKEFHV